MRWYLHHALVIHRYGHMFPTPSRDPGLGEGEGTGEHLGPLQNPAVMPRVLRWPSVRALVVLWPHERPPKPPLSGRTGRHWQLQRAWCRGGARGGPM